jgi:hypothetical protein
MYHIEIDGNTLTGISIGAALAICVIQEMRNNSRMTEQRKRDASLALSDAYSATEGYYAVLRGGSSKSIEREHEIAALWDRVADHFLGVNPELANRLGIKSQFWREGAAWTDDQIRAAKIKLDEIRQAGRISVRKGHLKL